MARSPWPMISIKEANAISLDEVEPLRPEAMDLDKALGLVLGEDVTAPEPQPPFRASIKDGYAVVAADGAGVFPVVADVRAEPVAEGTRLAAGTAYITTGAPVPEGADAVVQVEDTAAAPPSPRGTRRVEIRKAAAPAQDIRPVGSDVSQGEARPPNLPDRTHVLVLPAGSLLGPAELGLLASFGTTAVRVHRRPRVALMSTGDELAAADTAPGALRYGQVRDSNRTMLLAAAAEAGCACVDLGIIQDSAAALESALDAALAQGADVLVTSGGVSMGDRDLVKPLLQARGKVLFGRVLMKPGKPLTFAVVPSSQGARRMLVFGLPGNPVSSLVTWHLVVVPVLRKLAGWRDPMLRRVHVRTTAALKLDPERPEYHRARAGWGPDGALVAHSTGGQISSRLLSCRSANLLLELPQAAGVLPAGTLVSALVIGSLADADGLQAPPLQPQPVQPPAPAAAAPAARPRVGVLTVSDRASAGIYEDVSGPAIVAVLREYLATEVEFVSRVIPDERAGIAAALREMAAQGACLICTTGGTGPAPHDVTPEAMADVCDKMLPGFGEEMRRASLKDVPTAILSRQTAGVLGGALVLNIPGKPAAVRTCLDAVFAAIPYCVDLIGGPFLEGRPGTNVFRPKAK